MAQTPFSTGQTALVLSDLILRAKKKVPALNNGSPDFLGAAQITLASYALSYKGNYYITPAQGTPPTAFPTAESVHTLGSFYELPYPASALDSGVQNIEVLYGSSDVSVVPQALVINNQNEAAWDVSSVNTTTVYWRMAGRLIRMYVPITYISTPKYTVGFIRFPTYPGVVGDTLDVPAEDFSNFFSLWLGNILPD